MTRRVKKFSGGGSSGYEGYVPLNRKGAVIIDEKSATREDRARGAKEAFDRDLEGMRSAYESYKGKTDPTSQEISKRLSMADEEAIKKVQRAGRESDLTNERERNRYRAVDKYAKGGMAKGGKWIKEAIKKPGALRKSLGVKGDKPIPAGKLAKAAKAPGKLGQRARLAQTLKKMK